MKTHDELGITFRELGALLGTRALLQKGYLMHGKRPAPRDAHVFNMGVTCYVNGCGTVACIGGTMALLLGYSEKINDDDDGESYQASRYVDRGGDGTAKGQSKLRELFYPPSEWYDYDAIRNKAAIAAIDRYLNGDAPWPYEHRNIKLESGE